MEKKRIVVVNAGPRKNWNTDTLITEAAKGAEAAGAEITRFDLYRLVKYTGCISCFGCKKEKNKGRCVCRDGLTPVLDAIRESDGYPHDLPARHHHLPHPPALPLYQAQCVHSPSPAGRSGSGGTRGGSQGT